MCALLRVTSQARAMQSVWKGMDWMLCRAGGSSLAGGRAEEGAGEVLQQAVRGATASHAAAFVSAASCSQSAGLPKTRDGEKPPLNI